MKSIIKKLGQFDFIRSFVCWLGANYIRLVYITTRWKEQNREVPEKFRKLNRPFILAFWHGRILMTDSIKHIQKEYGSLEKAFITTVKGEKSWE